MPKKPMPDYPNYLLATERARAIAEGLLWQEDEQTIADFLLLFRATTYSDNIEDVLAAIEYAVTHYLRRANDALDELIAARLQAVKSRSG